MSKKTHLLSYLVHPNKGVVEEKQLDPIGGVIQLPSKLGQMLLILLDESETECNIGVVFSPTETGEKKNPMLDLILKFCEAPTLQNGKEIAINLSLCTTKLSGSCLLFLILQINEEGDLKFLISRFPASVGVVAESSDHKLELAYMEQVFMKSQTRYKAVLYQGRAVTDGLWIGKAIDKQVNYSSEDLAKYWIYQFLQSTYKDTSAWGTRRFTQALKDAVGKCDDPEIRRELTGMAFLIPGLAGKSTSISQILSQFQMSNEAKGLIISSLPNKQTKDTEFIFDRQEALATILYKSVELDNNAIMIAPSIEFNQIFVPSNDISISGDVTFTTQGKIVKEQFRRRK